MNITQEKKDDLNLLVKIDLETEDYMPQVETSLRNYSKKVQLKGFRKGKVPMGMVRKMYGNEILVEELNKLVSDNLNNFIKDNNIEYLGDPLPAEESHVHFDVNSPKNQSFAFELGLKPQFSIPAIDNAEEVTRYKITVDEKLVDDEVEHLRKRYGKMTNPDTVEEGDVLFVELVELDENGESKEGGVQNTPSLPLDWVEQKELKQQISGAKKGDTFQLNIFRDLNKAEDLIADRLLNLKVEELEEVNDNFRMTIKNINRVQPADIDKELFDKIYGKDAMTTEEAFRARVREELEGVLKVNADRQLNNDIAEKILDQTEIPLPKDFLRKWLIRTNENVTEDDLDQEFDPFLRNLKWSLIVNKVLAENEIKVEREDVEQRTQQLIRMEYGLPEGDESSREYLNQFTAELMKNRDHVSKVYENLREQKVLEAIKDKLTITEKAITYDEFKKISNG